MSTDPCGRCDALQQSLKALLHNSFAVTEKLEAAQANERRLVDDVHALRESLEACRSINARQAQEIQELRRDAEAERAKVLRAETDERKLANRVKSLERLLDEAKGETNVLAEQCKAKAADCAHLRLQVADTRSQMSSLAQELNDLKSRLASAPAGAEATTVIRAASATATPSSPSRFGAPMMDLPLLSLRESGASPRPGLSSPASRSHSGVDASRRPLDDGAADDDACCKAQRALLSLEWLKKARAQALVRLARRLQCKRQSSAFAVWRAATEASRVTAAAASSTSSTSTAAIMALAAGASAISSPTGVSSAVHLMSRAQLELCLFASAQKLAVAQDSLSQLEGKLKEAQALAESKENEAKELMCRFSSRDEESQLLRAQVQAAASALHEANAHREALVAILKAACLHYSRYVAKLSNIRNEPDDEGGKEAGGNDSSDRSSAVVGLDDDSAAALDQPEPEQDLQDLPLKVKALTETCTRLSSLSDKLERQVSSKDGLVRSLVEEVERLKADGAHKQALLSQAKAEAEDENKRRVGVESRLQVAEEQVAVCYGQLEEEKAKLSAANEREKDMHAALESHKTAVLSMGMQLERALWLASSAAQQPLSSFDEQDELEEEGVEDEADGQGVEDEDEEGVEGTEDDEQADDKDDRGADGTAEVATDATSLERSEAGGAESASSNAATEVAIAGAANTGESGKPALQPLPRRSEIIREAIGLSADTAADSNPLDHVSPRPASPVPAPPPPPPRSRTMPRSSVASNSSNQSSSINKKMRRPTGASPGAKAAARANGNAAVAPPVATGPATAATTLAEWRSRALVGQWRQQELQSQLHEALREKEFLLEELRAMEDELELLKEREKENHKGQHGPGVQAKLPTNGVAASSAQALFSAPASSASSSSNYGLFPLENDAGKPLHQHAAASVDIASAGPSDLNEKKNRPGAVSTAVMNGGWRAMVVNGTAHGNHGAQHHQHSRLSLVSDLGQLEAAASAVRNPTPAGLPASPTQGALSPAGAQKSAAAAKFVASSPSNRDTDAYTQRLMTACRTYSSLVSLLYAALSTAGPDLSTLSVSKLSSALGKGGAAWHADDAVGGSSTVGSLLRLLAGPSDQKDLEADRKGLGDSSQLNDADEDPQNLPGLTASEAADARRLVTSALTLLSSASRKERENEAVVSQAETVSNQVRKLSEAVVSAKNSLHAAVTSLRDEARTVLPPMADGALTASPGSATATLAALDQALALPPTPSDLSDAASSEAALEQLRKLSGVAVPLVLEAYESALLTAAREREAVIFADAAAAQAAGRARDALLQLLQEVNKQEKEEGSDDRVAGVHDDDDDDDDQEEDEEESIPVSQLHPLLDPIAEVLAGLERRLNVNIDAVGSIAATDGSTTASSVKSAAAAAATAGLVDGSALALNFHRSVALVSLPGMAALSSDLEAARSGALAVQATLEYKAASIEKRMQALLAAARIPRMA